MFETPINTPSQSLATIRELVKDDFDQVNRLIVTSLNSKISLIGEIAHHITQSGGKRLRPLLVLLSAKALGYQGENHIDLAVVIEFLHTATLLHDDVVDTSDLRRGQPTANAIWGNAASVLVGDFLYSRAFQIMASLKVMKVMEVLAAATTVISEGEVLQLMNRHNPDISEADYFTIIGCKTAKLFEAAAQLGAIVSGQTNETEIAIAGYGYHLGVAFQLIDDMLDYSANPEQLGKNLGDDLAEGKATLPLIYAMKHGKAEESKLIRNAIEKGGIENLPTIFNAISNGQGLEYTKKCAYQQAEKAIQLLQNVPNSPYRDALIALAQLSVTRNH